MVEREVNGQNVLVPVVYLASVRKGELKPDGALLAGGNIHLVTGDTLTNTGSIVASDRSDITAGSINNLGGTVKAGKELALTGKQDIINAGAPSAAPISAWKPAITLSTKLRPVTYSTVNCTR